MVVVMVVVGLLLLLPCCLVCCRCSSCRCCGSSWVLSFLLVLSVPSEEYVLPGSKKYLMQNLIRVEPPPHTLEKLLL